MFEDAIQEIVVLSGGISAEYGRFTGGVVNVITRSGGNDLSGSLRDTLSSDRWTSRTPFVNEPEHLRRINNDYEGTLDGVRLWAVVKANGYGHGAADVAGAALGAGATALCEPRSTY